MVKPHLYIYTVKNAVLNLHTFGRYIMCHEYQVPSSYYLTLQWCYPSRGVISTLLGVWESSKGVYCTHDVYLHSHWDIAMGTLHFNSALRHKLSYQVGNLMHCDYWLVCIDMITLPCMQVCVTIWWFLVSIVTVVIFMWSEGSASQQIIVHRPY